MIRVYVDASNYRNPGPGGIGIVVEQNGSLIEKKSIPVKETTTNGRLELLAVIEGLKLLIKKKYTNKPIILFSDSQYALGVATKVMTPRKNFEECEQIGDLASKFKSLKMGHIAGSQNPADYFARVARDEAAEAAGLYFDL